jgi:tight adherence protein B
VTAAVAIVAAGLAAWVLCGPPPELVRLRELTAPPATPRWRRSMARAAVRLRRVARPGRAGRDADAWRKTCLELCQALMAELTAGRSAEDALCRAVAAVEPPDPAVVRPVAAAARDGGDVPAALAEAARAPGAEGLRRLAACWRVSTAVGGSLTVLVEGVITALREAEAHRRDLTAQLAGPRATVRLLALLPALGILMAVGLGMNPLGFLFGGPAGLGCLVAGAALDVVGVVWIRRMVADAERTASI